MRNKFQSNLKQWGNSLGVVVPHDVVEGSGFQAGDRVEIEISGLSQAVPDNEVSDKSNTNLAATWRDIELRSGKPLSDVLQELNSYTGRSVTSGKLGYWEKGIQSPGTKPINYMLGRTLPVLLKELGITEEEVQKVVEQVFIA